MAFPPSQAILIVDGYNIIGAWSHLQKIRDRHGLELARRDLVEALVNYSAVKEYETKIVFDAQYQNRPSCTKNHTRYLSVHFTAFGETADTHIEKFCASFGRHYSRNFHEPRLIVATSDRAQRLTAMGYGAEWLSAQRLIGEVEVTSQRLKPQRRPPKSSQGRFLFNSLDPKAQKKLRAWLNQGKP